MMTRPLVSSSRPAMQCSSVDLPDPDGPITATIRADGISIDTQSSAVTAVGPTP
jgi:hypothetical protein